MAGAADPADTLWTLRQAPDIDGDSFNPVGLIRAVNGLLPLGKEAAVETMRAYVGLSRREGHAINEQRVFLVARVLFVPIDGEAEMPPLLIGAPSPTPPKAAQRQPLFPIVILRQIPFLAVARYGWMLGGHRQSPLDHLRFCAERCRLRAFPLVPETTAVDAVESAPLLRQPDWRSYRPLLRRQALRAMAPAYRLSQADLSAGDAEWDFHLHQIAALRPAWNSEAQEFEAIKSP